MGHSGGRVIDPAYSCFGRTHGALSLTSECPTLGYSGYSHGVSCAWTRVGGTRDGTVSGSPPVLARPTPSTPGVLGVLTRGSLEDPQGGPLDAHREYAKPPTRAL